MDRVPADRLLDLKSVILTFEGLLDEVAEVRARLRSSSDPFTACTSTLQWSAFFPWHYPSTSRRLVDEAMTDWVGPMPDDLALVAAGYRSLALARLNDAETADEIQRYFALEDRLGIHHVLGPMLIGVQAALAWIQDHRAAIDSSERLARYQLRSGHLDPSTAHIRDYVQLLAALADSKPDAGDLLRRYVSVVGNRRRPGE